MLVVLTHIDLIKKLDLIKKIDQYAQLDQCTQKKTGRCIAYITRNSKHLTKHIQLSNSS